MLRSRLAALTELQRISRKNANVPETKMANGAVKHRCFLSYHSEDAAEVLEFVEEFDSIFIPRSIGVSDADGDLIDSTSTDYVMDQIRERYLSTTTVTIVLVGACTWARRYVDWEVYSSLRKDKVNRLNGLMAITLPSVANDNNRRLPERVSANVLGTNGDEGYARWWKYPTSVSSTQDLIEDAFQARQTRQNLRVVGGERWKRNRTCPS